MRWIATPDYSTLTVRLLGQQKFPLYIVISEIFSFVLFFFLFPQDSVMGYLIPNNDKQTTIRLPITANNTRTTRQVNNKRTTKLNIKCLGIIFPKNFLCCFFVHKRFVQVFLYLFVQSLILCSLTIDAKHKEIYFQANTKY
jgi:hypothetical protein